MLLSRGLVGPDSMISFIKGKIEYKGEDFFEVVTTKELPMTLRPTYFGKVLTDRMEQSIMFFGDIDFKENDVVVANSFRKRYCLDCAVKKNMVEN